jgi:hypothetical protein
MPLQFAALIAGFATSILAAVFTSGTGPVDPVVRVILIVLPALGSAFTTFIVQAKLLEQFQLRENGRLAIQSFSTEAKQKFACLKSDEELCAFFEELRKRVDEVEAKQSDSFFGLLGANR